MAATFGIDRPALMAIVGEDGALPAGRVIRAGADLVQVRAKHLNARDLMKLVRSIIGETGDSGRVIVHSRPDVAELAGAFGVHLGESGLDPGSVRRAFPGLVVGVSRHDRPGLERAFDEGADYAILGPVFETPGKEAEAMGVAAFSRMVGGLSFPVLAVGGISPDNVASLLRAGARGVAAIRPFAEPETAGLVAASFRAALDDRGRASRS